jgi:beta-glucanase (GH16 family)
VPGDGWRPAFHDEFDGTALDASKWSDHDPWQSKGYSADSAWFPVPHTSRQLSVGSGVLTMRARRGTGLPEGKSFTSVQVNSKDKYAIPAGATSYTEARIKAPSAAGTWPGFWLLGNGTNTDGGGWPITGEVDILEFANNKDERGAPYFSVWYPKDVYTRAPGSFLNGTHDTHPGSFVKRPHLLDTWHTWGLLRSPQKMELHIDGQLIATFRPGQSYNNKMPLPPMLFRNAQHLRLSLLVGGWGGNGLTESQYREGDLSVDYVRVWTR